ncbi:CDK-activating kinase assembly factor MAT1 [Coccinella septempunctata]|uniref:CDK-activating kinase assembly factor MAT1 n=1 Tax=Coccinella septempunctata TaxID=41139 RepID=UPI001D096888|nr:CDK-activating kinase assembly factor MAT1 [Coccinella septempunctata]
MEDFVCPRCRTSKFQNPSLKMMVNVCGHGLCENCVDLLFLKGSGNCPECRIPLRRNNFRIQLFEDATVEKEVDIRKRILRDFNRKEEDFKSLREYNDYLEEVETIIYNLCNNIDVIETNKKIEQYKKDNKDVIQKNKGKLGRDEYELEELLELEKQQDEFRRKEIKNEEILAKKKKIKDKEALLDELMFSNTNAKNILESFAEKAKEEEVKPPPQKMTQFSTGIQFGRQNQSMFLPIPNDESPLYSHKTISYETKGPSPPNDHDIISKGFLSNVRCEVEQERAGGFQSTISCMRAIQDALCGLYHTKKPLVHTH